MKPDSALFSADRTDQRAAVSSQCDSLFLCGGGSYLLWLAIRNALTPDVETVSRIRREIHPVSIGRPCRARALAGNRSHRLASRTPVERKQTARQPPLTVHLNHDCPLVVGRKIGAVRHTEFAWRRAVHVAFLVPAFCSGRDFHVYAFGYFREHHALPADPGEARSIRQHEPGSSAGDGHNPGVPSPALYGGVRYACSIRRKGGAHLGKIVVSELERLSIGQQLYIDLSTTLEGILSADKRKQTAVRGQRGGSCGIGVVRQLGVL